jgi:uncharacterized CHY-type Zn-finger protein
MERERPKVAGLALDAQTRCAHYYSPVDVIAIKMKCCGIFYACVDCHEALADHPIVVWPQAEWSEPAVLCGVCSTEMSISRYLTCSDRCPQCDCSFNPRCRDHHAFYFACEAAQPNARSSGA